MKIDATRSAVAYHKEDGAITFPYAVDAHSAVARFPDEWSWDPWAADGKKLPPVIEIPDGWQDLKPMQRINLAVALGTERRGLTAAKADEILQAEVDRREAEAEAPPPKPKSKPNPDPMLPVKTEQPKPDQPTT